MLRLTAGPLSRPIVSDSANASGCNSCGGPVAPWRSGESLRLGRGRGFHFRVLPPSVLTLPELEILRTRGSHSMRLSDAVCRYSST